MSQTVVLYDLPANPPSRGPPVAFAWPAKDPGDTVKLSVDFVRIIGAGRIVTAAACQVITTGSVILGTPVMSGSVVTVLAGGGSPGEVASVLVTVTLDDGETLRRGLLLPVLSQGIGIAPPNPVVLTEDGVLLLQSLPYSNTAVVFAVDPALPAGSRGGKLLASLLMDQAALAAAAVGARLGAATQGALILSFAVSSTLALTAAQMASARTFRCQGLFAGSTLTVPLAQHEFVVRNESASYALTVGGATGATVLVAAGAGLMLQTDGVDTLAIGSAAADHAAFTQAAPAAVWVIAHTLNRYPALLILDGTGRVMEADVIYDTVNQMTVTFSRAVNGTAYLL